LVEMTEGGCGLVVGDVVVIVATAAGVSTAGTATVGVATLTLVLILLTVLIAVLGVFDVAAVARGYALQHVAILVKTGNLD